MSTTTARFGLTKPAYTDTADIAVLNTNSDTEDAALAGLNIANTFGASGTIDMSGAGTNAFILPSKAGSVPTADGVMGFDTTAHAPVYGSNGATVHFGYQMRSRTVILQGTTSYAIPSGVRALLVQALGAGGGGGGSSSSAGASGAGGGGGGGGYSESFLTSLPASPVTVQVGAGGAGGAAGANDGNDGTATLFNTTTVTANGGLKGLGDTASGTSHVQTGGLGGTVGTGDVAHRGVPAQMGKTLTTSWAIGGQGGAGSGPHGGGGGQEKATGGAANGSAGVIYGAGGSGGAQANGGGAVTGGDGANGIMVIWEFY